MNVPNSGENGLNAFIWDSSRLEHEAAEDCELTTAGEYFGRSGYGIALRKESPWINDISLEVLKFHESACHVMQSSAHVLCWGSVCYIVQIVRCAPAFYQICLLLIRRVLKANRLPVYERNNMCLHHSIEGV